MVYLRLEYDPVFKQLFNFVRPGYKRIDISTSLSDITVSAFCDPADGAIVITGKNDSDRVQTIGGILKNNSTVSLLKYYFTDASHNFFRGSDVKVTNQTFLVLIPAYCVFTLASK